jgi:DNA-binding FrmR family transcriptional regulator
MPDRRAEVKGSCLGHAYRILPYPMSHTATDRHALLTRVRRLRGQIEGVEQGLVVELLEDHLTEHVVKVADGADRARGAAELTEVIRRYLK